MIYKTNNTLILIKGVSGIGKSTRVFQFLKFCESLNWKIKPFYLKNKEIGKLIVPLNFIILGKIVIPDKSTKKERWQGFDSFTSYFEGSEGVSKWMKEILLEHSLLLEGASILDSFRFRPLYIEQVLGVKNYHLFTYIYQEDEVEEYKNRIKERSGYPPKSLTMWAKNKGSFLPTLRKNDNEVKAAGLNPKDFSKNISLVSWDVPVTQLGKEILIKLNRNDLIDNFLNWSKEHNYAEILKHGEQKPKEKKQGSIFG